MGITFLLIPLALVALVIWGFSGLYAVASSRIWQGFVILERGSLFIWRRIEPWGQGLLPVRHPGHTLVLTVLGLATLRAGLRDTGVVARNSRPVAWWCADAFGIGTLPMLLALGSVADKLLSLTRRPRVARLQVA